MIFSKLARHHDRAAFDCGVAPVNRYLRGTARQQAEKGLALTFVLLEDEGEGQIIGFYTLVMSTVACAIVPASEAARTTRNMRGV